MHLLHLVTTFIENLPDQWVVGVGMNGAGAADLSPPSHHEGAVIS